MNKRILMNIEVGWHQNYFHVSQHEDVLFLRRICQFLFAICDCNCERFRSTEVSCTIRTCFCLDQVDEFQFKKWRWCSTSNIQKVSELFNSLQLHSPTSFSFDETTLSILTSPNSYGTHVEVQVDDVIFAGHTLRLENNNNLKSFAIFFVLRVSNLHCSV